MKLVYMNVNINFFMSPCPPLLRVPGICRLFRKKISSISSSSNGRRLTRVRISVCGCTAAISEKQEFEI